MKKNNMDFLQAFNTTEISLFGDADKDKVPNVLDCKPFDKDRDGLFGRVVNILTMGGHGQTKEEYNAEKIENTKKQGLEYQNKLELINQKNKLIEKKLKVQQEIATRQQLLYLRSLATQPQPSPSQMLVSNIFGISMQQPKGVSLGRPGYKIVYAPKLPKGYRWEKITKKEKRQEHQHEVTDGIEHRAVSYPEAQHIQHQIRQIYGYTPEIFKVTDPFSRMTFFVVVEPRL